MVILSLFKFSNLCLVAYLIIVLLSILLDYQIPHGNQLIQYKSIEFPPAITSFYNEEQERFGDNVSVNKVQNIIQNS